MVMKEPFLLSTKGIFGWIHPEGDSMMFNEPFFSLAPETFQTVYEDFTEREDKSLARMGQEFFCLAYFFPFELGIKILFCLYVI